MSGTPVADEESTLFNAEALYEEVARGAPRILPDMTLGAIMRPTPEDFIVEEIPHYTPSGEGEHLYLRIEKRDASTPQLIAALSQRYKVKERDIGFAGRKDRHGVSRQWVSLPARAVPDEGKQLLDDTRFKILEAGRHNNKLRLGHLKGNRFIIGVHVSSDMLTDERLAEIDVRVAKAEAEGLPHVFGDQRFFFRPAEAHRGVDNALRFVRRGHRPRSRRDKFSISVLQSVLFQSVLRARIADGLFHRCIVGDLLVKTDGRSVFSCEDPETDTARHLAGEICPTGPMVGVKMRPPGGEAMTRESRSLGGFVSDLKLLMAHPAFDSGERRRLRIFATDVVKRRTLAGLELAFSLPKGAYATVFMREILGSDTVDGAQIAGGEA